MPPARFSFCGKNAPVSAKQLFSIPVRSTRPRRPRSRPAGGSGGENAPQLRAVDRVHTLPHGFSIVICHERRSNSLIHRYASEVPQKGSCVSPLQLSRALSGGKDDLLAR